jgi:hypothetical protein
MVLDEVLQELRRLSEPVPRPRQLPSAADVDLVQQRLGTTFHPDYRKYLLVASDVVLGTKEPCTVAPGGGHTDLVRVASNAWDRCGLPRTLLPVCEDNGDYYCLQPSGEVVFWALNGPTDERWPDLATWIKKVWIDEG